MVALDLAIVGAAAIALVVMTTGKSRVVKEAAAAVAAMAIAEVLLLLLEELTAPPVTVTAATGMVTSWMAKQVISLLVALRMPLDAAEIKVGLMEQEVRLTAVP